MDTTPTNQTTDDARTPRRAESPTSSCALDMLSAGLSNQGAVDDGLARRPSLKRPLEVDAEFEPSDLQLLKVIGRGTFAQQVALAKDRHTSNVYAVKSCDKQNLVQRKQVVHTWTEKKILEQLRGHPFVVTLFSTFATPDEVHFVLEYCPGGELFYHLHQHDHFNEAIVRFYAAEVLCALKSLHSANIVYRDLKPENVLLDAQGHIRLADFGFCKDLGDCDRTYSFCGSPEYLSPEMIARRGHSTATDMWSFGCFCYELAVGHPPFQLHEDSLPDLFSAIRAGRVYYPQELSPTFVTFLKGCLETDIATRLTASKAMDEPFFDGVNWKKVWALQNEPPFQPCVLGSECTRNFDDDFTSESPRSPVWGIAPHKRNQSMPSSDVFTDF
ncbi:AGC protein kinase [Saprolegnia parasitica CBS 223.65]|uniref:AGC protein kinase n=1 Tax=Saprolegnia parasitica (strain CBS 223.65) TaxID=695850 RepID=A0A067D5K9_SAPPC|nr:AGC protein kinase [Saprolegnia parasitica CBS 223.65]KDO34001.1 AGC protein kinase [Saprolegnia parasitica CBS 223.65]|eukprot:XP_012194887.1 AGC protein kinase [Saprolegnia parasitica CBS 223.65]